MDKVIEIMEHNGYYDYIDNQQFDVTDQVGTERIIVWLESVASTPRSAKCLLCKASSSFYNFN